MLEYRLVLMNKQSKIKLGLSHVPHRHYSQGVPITTVGESLRWRVGLGWAGVGGWAWAERERGGE